MKFKKHGIKAIQSAFRVWNMAIICTPNQQGLINWKTMRPFHPGKATVDAVMYAPLQGWTLCPVAMCQDHNGTQYIQTVSMPIRGTYSSSQLGGMDERYLVEQADGGWLSVIDHHVQEFARQSNQTHVKATAWVLVPNIVEIDEKHVSDLLDAVGAWDQESTECAES